MWAAIHYLIWDGKVSNTQDIISSLLSPGDRQASQSSPCAIQEWMSSCQIRLIRLASVLIH
jgi:hypothetical protein